MPLESFTNHRHFYFYFPFPPACFCSWCHFNPLILQKCIDCSQSIFRPWFVAPEEGKIIKNNIVFSYPTSCFHIRQQNFLITLINTFSYHKSHFGKDSLFLDSPVYSDFPVFYCILQNRFSQIYRHLKG